MESAANPQFSKTLSEQGGNKVEMGVEPDESSSVVIEEGSASTPLISKPVGKQGKNKAEMGAEPGVSVANDDESAPKERQEQQKIQKPMDFLSRFNAIFDDTTSTKPEKKKNFETLLNRDDVILKNIYVQKAFVKMLNDIAKYEEDLKLFIVRFAAHNERIETKYLINKDQRTMRELDAPLHCAVRQLNEGFIEWLLEQPETEVNLRNKQKETALAVLCQKYDCLSKFKTRVKDIEKDRKTTDKIQQLWLDDEKIEVTNQMNAPTHMIELIKILLEKGADFNIYMNGGALPFDFLRKYDTEAHVAEIINLYIKSNVAMTEKPPKPLNARAEGKKKSKNRIVKFYKKTEDMDVHVTVELLEIFICFKDLEKFEYYWKDFKVTSDNVKKVITQLLHVAVERNYTPYVNYIIKKASKEIFKLEKTKATQTQESTRSVTPGRHRICWCFKCCKKRNDPVSPQSESIELRAITSKTPDKCELTATEGAQPQTQSGTSKLQVTDPHIESGTSKLKGTVPQTQCETIQSQENNQVSQDNHVFTTEGTPTTDEQPSGWCCLKCFQKKQNPSLPDGTNPQAQRLNSKDLVKAEENKMVHHNELKGLLNMVCLNGNVDLLNMFLEKMNDRLLLNESPLLINTLNEAYRMKQEKESIFLMECIKILINNHKQVDMYRVDLKGNTALHLALSYGYDTIALLMLKKVHSLMWFRNHQNKTPIEYGTTEFWKTYLDSCISTNNDESELRFDVGFLKPRAKYESSDSFIRIVNDMTALHFISKFKDRKEVLMHPVIIAFITLKWKPILLWNILNLLITAFTMGTFMVYTIMLCSTVGWQYDYKLFATYGLHVTFVRLTVQYFTTGYSYKIQYPVDLLTMTSMFAVLTCECNRFGMCSTVPFLLSFVVVSLSLQITFLLAKIQNNLFIMFFMFKTVSISFFKGFLYFTPVFGAFACSFYRTFIESGFSVSNGTEFISSEQNFNNSHSAWDATIKTLVMTAGDAVEANIFVDDTNGFWWLLIIVFSFIVPIVIMNLINGLAVSDIADIRKESELLSLCEKVRLLKLYEDARLRVYYTMFFENYESIIYVMLNKKNNLAIENKRKNNTKEVIPRFPWLPSYMSLDQSYVDKANTIVRRQFKNNSGLGTSELADTEQTDRPALVNKTAMNQHKTSTLSRSATGPSVSDSRDKQAEILQEQVRSMIGMLTDIHQQLAGKHVTKAESTAGTSKISK